jgi:hypothetical protein
VALRIARIELKKRSSRKNRPGLGCNSSISIRPARSSPILISRKTCGFDIFPDPPRRDERIAVAKRFGSHDFS